MLTFASLSIPNFESPQSRTVTSEGVEVNFSSKPDTRLNRQLTIQEFILAFGKYKRIMTMTSSSYASNSDLRAGKAVVIMRLYLPNAKINS
jgi:hypothetical protein